MGGMRVLLTGTRAPVALDLARSFRASGHEVHGADHFPVVVMAGELAGFTAHAAPRFAFDAFAREAESIVSRIKPDLIIPLCEEIFHWTKASGGRWPLFAPDLAILMRLHSKFAFIELARSLGLDAPETGHLQDTSDVSDKVLKPEFSRFGGQVLVRPKSAPRDDDPRNPWLAQAYVPGEDLSFHAIASGGQVRAFAAYRSEWRTRGGASYYFDPVEDALSRRLRVMAETLAAALGLTGQFACDVRCDGDDRLWLIECNPRATSGLHLLAHDPAGLAEAFLSDRDDVLLSDGRPACVGPAMRLVGWPKALAEGRLGMWQADIGCARDVFAGKSGAALVGSAQLMLKATLAGKGLSDFLTADFECNRDLTC